MKEFKVTISKDDVFSEVEKISAYEAARNGSKENPDDPYIKAMISIEDDRDLLGIFWKDAITNITRSLMKYLVSSNQENPATSTETEGDDSLILDLSFRDTVYEKINILLSNHAYQYAVSYIVGMWFSKSFVEKAPFYIEKSKADLDSLVSASNMRTSGIMRSVTP